MTTPALLGLTDVRERYGVVFTDPCQEADGGGRALPQRAPPRVAGVRPDQTLNTGETAVFVIRNFGDRTEYVTGTDEWGGLIIEQREYDSRVAPDEDLSFFRLSLMMRPEWQGILPALAAAINDHTPPSEASEIGQADG